MHFLERRLLDGYDTALNHSGISGSRVAARLSAISQIGLTGDNGSCRIGFSKEETEAKQLVASWMKEADLAVTMDAAGNVTGRLTGQNPKLPAVLCGSHVDTVPNGGHFDGVLGIIVALEVVDAWRERGYVPPRSLEIVVFSDEEGTRFNVGFMGSSAMAGLTSEMELSALVDHENRSFEEAVRKAGLSAERFAEAQRDFRDVAAYVEVHIEQGTTLEREDLPVGIVSGIAGLSGLEVTFKGQAGHAGNTPMAGRKDALVAASQLVLAIRSIPSAISPAAVATVGQMHVYPNGTNVIPGEVRLSVDARDITKAALDDMVLHIEQTADQIAKACNVELVCRKVYSTLPTPAAEALRDLQTESLTELGIRPILIPSGAGHDAMIIGQHVPMAMFFVRSKNGLSHNPGEWTSLGDCVHAAHALHHFLRKLFATNLLRESEG